MIHHVTFLETKNMIFLQHQYEASEKFQSNLTVFGVVGNNCCNTVEEQRLHFLSNRWVTRIST